jgi:hypothetical protein
VEAAWPRADMWFMGPAHSKHVSACTPAHVREHMRHSSPGSTHMLQPSTRLLATEPSRNSDRPPWLWLATTTASAPSLAASCAMALLTHALVTPVGVGWGYGG